MEFIDASTLADAVLGRFAAPIEHAVQPFVMGLSGLQGSGKSTLAAALIDACRERGWPAVAISLDDAYLGRAEREELAARVHPLLRTRGVPGTHDLALLSSTLSALEKASPDRPVAVPRFDKGHDDRYEPALWPALGEMPQLVVLEGWCVGVEPETDAALVEPVNALERDEDADGAWRRWVNARIVEYLPLWRRLDALVLLEAPSWDIVARWRDEAERPLRERREPHAMDEAALARFLMHYERISRHALRSLPDKADVRIRLSPNRTPTLPNRPAP